MMADTYFEASYLDVDYLDDYNKTILELKSRIPEESKLLRLTLSTRDEYDEEYLFLEKYSSFDELNQNFNPADYQKVNNIDVLVIMPNHLSTGFHVDKSNNQFLIQTERVQQSKQKAEEKKSKKELLEMFKEDNFGDEQGAYHK